MGSSCGWSPLESRETGLSLKLDLKLAVFEIYLCRFVFIDMINFSIYASLHCTFFHCYASAGKLVRTFRRGPKAASSKKAGQGVCHLCRAGQPGFDYEDMFLAQSLICNFVQVDELVSLYFIYPCISNIPAIVPWHAILPQNVKAETTPVLVFLLSS